MKERRFAAKSKIRWQGDEEDRHLTWGVIMSGKQFVDVMKKHGKPRGFDKILEIGPGYGRLLDELLRRTASFKDYVGYDLSEARVKRLNKKYVYAAQPCEFHTGDITEVAVNGEYSVVICSSTFEHFWPDFRTALKNLYRENVQYFIDFIDQQLDASNFHDDTYFVRVYTIEQIIKIFEEEKYKIVGCEEISFGKSSDGTEVKRILVIANT